MAHLAVFAMTAAATPRIDRIGLASHVAAAIGASVELAEDFEQVGHGHGMALLVLSKFAREMNCLRESAEDIVEDVHLDVKGAVKRAASVIWSALASRVTAAVLSICALYAAALEVIEDLSPGGHHGAVLLAFNELLELLEQSGLVKGFAMRVLENHVLRLIVVGGALTLALAEVVGGWKLGGHHGVAVLAAVKTVRCIGLVRNAWREKED